MRRLSNARTAAEIGALAGRHAERYTWPDAAARIRPCLGFALLTVAPAWLPPDPGWGTGGVARGALDRIIEITCLTDTAASARSRPSWSQRTQYQPGEVWWRHLWEPPLLVPVPPGQTRRPGMVVPPAPAQTCWSSPRRDGRAEGNERCRSVGVASRGVAWARDGGRLSSRGRIHVFTLFERGPGRAAYCAPEAGLPNFLRWLPEGRP
jgi:hypothetical protein